MVNDKTVQSVISKVKEVRAVRYIPHRKKALTDCLATLSEDEKWLVTFCTWDCLFNSKLKVVDMDRITLPKPAEENSLTFVEFIEFLRRFKNTRISPSREKHLRGVLSKCDQEHREFYVSLLTKTWTEGLSIVELEASLDIDSITSESIYGEIEFLKTNFSELRYPVSIRRVSSKQLVPYILVRESLSSTLLEYGKEGYKRVPKSDKVEVDLKLSTTPRFILAGFRDSDMFYPTDYFSSHEELAGYMDGDYAATYSYRLSNLNSFLDRSMLVHSDASSVMFTDNEKSMIDAISTLSKEGTTDLLISDVNSTRTGKAHRLTCRLASGIIESATSDSVSLWFNGELVNCSYKFEGKEQALLTSPEIMKGKVMDFHFVKIGNTEYCFGKGINWRQEKWRGKRRGSDLQIEKCVMCGSIKHKHVTNGLCKGCESGLSYYFDKYGTDIWIDPSPQMKGKRYRSVWKSKLLNVVGIKYKGTVIEAREDGFWKFRKGDIDGQIASD